MTGKKDCSTIQVFGHSNICMTLEMVGSTKFASAKTAGPWGVPFAR